MARYNVPQVAWYLGERRERRMGIEEFGLSLDMTGGALPSGMAATGGANGTRFNSVGAVVAQVAPRFDYNPATLASRGLNVEPSETNYWLNSETGLAGWDPVGCMLVPVPNTLFTNLSSITLTNTLIGLASIDSSSAFIPVVNGDKVTLTIACLNVSMPTIRFGVTASTAGFGAAGDTVASVLYGPGTLSQITGGLWQVSGATGWTIVQITRTFLAVDTAYGVGYLVSGAAAQSLKIGMIQIEKGAGSSYIITGNAITARTADAITLLIPANINNLTFTFDDLSSATVGVTPGATYAIPTTFARSHILKITGAP